MKKWTKRILALLCSLAMILSGLYMSAPEAKAADGEPTMVTLDGFETVTISDFAKNGVSMPEGTYRDINGNGTLKAYSLADGTSLDGKLLSMKVKFTGGSGNARLDVAGTGEWSGFSVFASATANYMHIYTNYGWAEPAKSVDIPITEAGLTSVLDTEFILQMSIDYVESEGIKIDTYINGILCNSSVIPGVANTKFGGYLGIYCQDAGKTITVSSVGDGAVEKKPIEVEGFQTLSLGDFKDDAGSNMPAGRYEGSSGGAHNVFYAKNSSNLDKKLISMKILYEGGEYTHSLIFGGNGGWCGFNLRPSGDGTYLLIDSTWAGDLVDKSTYAAPTMTADMAGVTSFIQNEFILQMSMEYGEVDANNRADLTIGVYINGRLYNNQKFVIPGCNMSNVGNVIALYRQVDGSAIVVDTVKEPIMPDETFEKLTFADYGIYDKCYPYVSGDLAMQGFAEKATLDKTVTCGSILLEGSNSSQIIWAGKGGWDGLRMFPSASGSMSLVWYQGSTGTPVGTLSSDVAGVNFVGEEYDIMLSAELVGNDIKVGIWFNGVLYNQEFFTIAGMGEQFGTHFSVYCASESDKVTLTSAPELLKTVNEDYEKVTFLHYAVKDGVYDHANVSGTYEEATETEGRVLIGDICLNGGPQINLMWGFVENSWYGIRLVRYDDSTEMKLVFQTPDSYTEPLTINTRSAGVDFNNGTFNLMWSMALVDKDGDQSKNDLEIGLWFNGNLYKNQFVYINDYPYAIGNRMETHCGEGSTITFTSDAKLSATVPIRHNKIHFPAVEPDCHKIGNIEYWYCTDCEGFWEDEACTRVTNSKRVILPATGSDNVVHFERQEPACHYNGRVEYWYCPDCEGFWEDEACTRVTNSKSVILPATGSDNVIHVEAKEPACNAEGNIEYWHCPDCEQFWEDEACTRLTNALSVRIGATEHNTVHFEAVEPDCHKIGNIEYWYCPDCEGFWEDEACTRVTNSKSVILPATGSDNVVHFDAVAPGCHYIGNIEYWFCPDCEGFWEDAAFTRLTNSKSVILPATGSENVVHVEAKAPTCKADGNIEHWYCKDCEQFWQNKELTQLTNSKNVILGKADHKAVKLPAVAAQVGKTGLTEGSKCSVCGTILKAQVKTPALKLAKPKASKVTKATGGKKQITVKFKKISGVTRYEIQYSLKKNMKGAKTVKVTKSKDMKAGKIVIKKLKAKKTYYVRIRTVKTVNGVTAKSSWSKVLKASKTK